VGQVTEQVVKRRHIKFRRREITQKTCNNRRVVSCAEFWKYVQSSLLLIRQTISSVYYCINEHLGKPGSSVNKVKTGESGLKSRGRKILFFFFFFFFFLRRGVYTGSGAHPALYSNSADVIPQGYSAWGKTLIPLNKV
jgi:hypothetical protein